jgi:hypothetical protein
MVHFYLYSKFNSNLKTLLRQGISQTGFYGDVIYKLRKILGHGLFSAVFTKIIKSVTLNKYVRIFCLRPNNQTFYYFINLFNSIVVNLIKYCSLITISNGKPHGNTKVRMQMKTIISSCMCYVTVLKLLYRTQQIRDFHVHTHFNRFSFTVQLAWRSGKSNHLIKILNLYENNRYNA